MGANRSRYNSGQTARMISVQRGVCVSHVIMCIITHTLTSSQCCVLCQEASDLSSLKTQLEERGVSLFAVVKENMTSEIQDFRAYFNGEIFLDQQVITGAHDTSS